MSNAVKAGPKAITLAIRKSSVVAPLFLLLITIFLFVIYALPSEHADLANRFGLKGEKPDGRAIMDRAGEVFTAVDSTRRNELWKELGSSPWLFVTDILRPLLKVYLEQLAADFTLIVASMIGTVSTLALYSLIPGLAGLFYRRQFLFWFLASFAILLAIDVSGLFPSLSGNAQPMPGSGRLLMFLLAQMALLFVAFRLRRQSTSAGRIPPRLWNWALTGILTLCAIALYQLWRPFGSEDARLAALDMVAERRAGAASSGWRDCDTCPGLALLDQPYPPVPAGEPAPALLPSLPGEQVLPPSFNEARRREAAQRRDQMKLVKLPLYMTKFEVTHDEWDACTRHSPAACPALPRRNEHTGRLPVEVSFEAAKAYAAWLSEQSGSVYRLASPIEWEYAARAGAPFTDGWSHGNDVNALKEYAWYFPNFEGARHVGLKKPNRYGLFDMHGNMREWVDICRAADGSLIAGCNDQGTHKTTLGGSFNDRPEYLRFGAAVSTEAKSGIRLVREGGATPKLQPVAPSDSPPAERSESVWSLFTSGPSGWIFKWEVILIGLPLVYSLLRNSGAWTERKRKNIVICLDGTSNTPDQVEQGFAATTNVYKLFRMLKSDSAGMFQPGELLDASLCKRYKSGDAQQIGLYYAGVGNKYDNDPILQVLGLATGAGAGDVIERAYLDLVRVYQTGDRVFIFGFSRGAAIARLLARAIDARRAPRSVLTIKLFGKHRTIWASKAKQPVAIDVLGCWDTVGSFGIAKTIAGINFQQLNMGRDLSVPENVLQAYHMLALDEQRDSFEPTLMDPDPNRPERIVEVWFAGDHANVGGGWATDRLSDITLDFLLSRISSGYAQSAERAGQDESWGVYLKAWKADKADYWERQDDNPHIVDPDPLGQISQWFSRLYQYRPRKLPQHAVISDTVFSRMIDSMPLYAPQALFNLNDDLDRRRDLIAEQVSKLQETSLLSDDDLKKIEGYKAKLRLNRFEDYWNNKVLPARKGRFKQPVEALANGTAKPAAGGASAGTS
jgi:hypothetical protein